MFWLDTVPLPLVDVTEAHIIKEDQLLKMMAQCFFRILIATCRIATCHNREIKDNKFFVILFEKLSDTLAKLTQKCKCEVWGFQGMWQRVVWKICSEKWGSGIFQNICKYLPTQTFSFLRQQRYMFLIPTCENLKCHGVLFVLDRVKCKCHYANLSFCNRTLFILAEFSDIRKNLSPKTL